MERSIPESVARVLFIATSLLTNMSYLLIETIDLNATTIWCGYGSLDIMATH